MTTLITGGTGKMGLALAKLLHQANFPVLIASRSGQAPEPFNTVKFDWFDRTTFEGPFNVNDTNQVDRVYIVAPPGRIDGSKPMKDFIDLAVSKGVNRFVLVSATQISPDDSMMPTDNFGTRFATSIRDYDHVFSAAQDGKIPFVSTEDIAQAVFDALTAKASFNKDLFVLGPELHSYDDVVKLLSSVLGRDITHRKFGLNAQYADFLAGMDFKVANGDEAALFNGKILDSNKFVGKHTLLEYIKSNKNIWLTLRELIYVWNQRARFKQY